MGGQRVLAICQPGHLPLHFRDGRPTLDEVVERGSIDLWRSRPRIDFANEYGHVVHLHGGGPASYNRRPAAARRCRCHLIRIRTAGYSKQDMRPFILHHRCEVQGRASQPHGLPHDCTVALPSPAGPPYTHHHLRARLRAWASRTCPHPPPRWRHSHRHLPVTPARWPCPPCPPADRSCVCVCVCVCMCVCVCVRVCVWVCRGDQAP
jgi:hypothetical protein